MDTMVNFDGDGHGRGDGTIYSAIHKAASSLVTGHSQKYWWLERPPEAIPPLTASWMEW